MFLLIVLGLLGAIYGYTGWRLITPAQFSFPWNLVAGLAVVLLMLLTPGLMFLRHFISKHWWGDLLAWLTYLSLGFFVLTFFLLILRDLVWLALVGLDHIIALAGPADPRPLIPATPARRQFLLNTLNLGVLGLAGGLAGYGLYQARRTPRVVEISVPLDDLPADLDGFRIAQISDLHVGPTIKRAQVQAMVDQVNDSTPDLIAFTGDLADRPVPSAWPHVLPLAGLRAPHGCFFVTGNHEYYAGVEAWTAAVQKLGFTVLLNQHQLLEQGKGRLLLAGVPDYNAVEIHPSHPSDPQAAMADAPPADVRILLAHQPRSIQAAARAGFDLQLSGHTHGGQFIPWNFVVRLQQPYVSGLHRFERTWIYVNRGAGYWGPPLRLGAPPEITLITLKTA